MSETLDTCDETLFTFEPGHRLDEVISFVEPLPDEKPPSKQSPWKVLIVDDEKDVHVVTKMAMKNIHYLNRPLQLLSSFSAAEARKVLKKESDIAIVFLDVIMETEDAGLKLVHFIRQDLNNPFVRIILRTGQPGQVPEREVVSQYDIDDYKTKTDLTSDRLFTTVLSALRSYHALIDLESHRQDLEEKVWQRTKDLRTALHDTFKGSLHLLSEILSIVSPEAFMRSQRVSKMAEQISKKLPPEQGWKLEVAAMLSQIGCVAVPDEILKKAFANERLEMNEAGIYMSYTQTGRQLLKNLPNLEAVADIIGAQHDTFPGRVSEESEFLLHKLLKVMNELDSYIARGLKLKDSLEELSHHPEYREDSYLIELLREAVHEIGEFYVVESVSLDDLKIGSILVNDIKIEESGLSLMARGQLITPLVKIRLKNWNGLNGRIQEPIQIAVRP